MRILSPDTEGKETCVYTGPCNMKLIDKYDMDMRFAYPWERDVESDLEFDLEEDLPVILADQFVPDTQNQVWIDPARSPFVYNHYGWPQSEEYYSTSYQSSTNMTVQQQNTYNITEYNFYETVHYSTHEDVEKKTKMQVAEQMYYREFDDEYQCGVYLSKLPEEIIYQQNRQAIEERKFIGLQTENSALKQLMSPGIQSMTRQRKTILFLGADTQSGQTIQQIGYFDTNMECAEAEPVPDREIVIDDTTKSPKRKRYQCAKCRKIFDTIGEFREHKAIHGAPKYRKCKKVEYGDDGLRYVCGECGKSLKTKEKFEKHCQGHGDPELECNKCFKVFATKFSLRAHSKIHNRKYRCPYCPKAYSSVEEMRWHTSKQHDLFHCNQCDYTSNKESELIDHKQMHENFMFNGIHHKDNIELNKLSFIDKDLQEIYANNNVESDQTSYNSSTTESIHDDNYRLDSSETDFTDSLFDDVLSDDTDPDWKIEDELGVNGKHQKSQNYYKIQQAVESVMAEIMDKDQKSENQIQKPADSVIGEVIDDDQMIQNDEIQQAVNSVLPKVNNKHPKSQQDDETRKDADSVIAKVMSNKIFLAGKLKKNNKRCKKVCDVCQKSFDRVSDLKRHLIEHIVRSTLAKTPVSSDGTLIMQCEVCQRETFTKVDRYKAHLREHAKLTLYKCTFCDKSFSDSSNFSKHKKIHGATYLQCDLCQRKFNSKKMLERHMEYHKENQPLPCLYCDREFHFESMLNKHIKSAHTKNMACRFRCRFCNDYFTSLKDKWDHEWMVHNVRKSKIDCRECGAKFRKYAELKRHCIRKHDIEIPTAKKLLSQCFDE